MKDLPLKCKIVGKKIVIEIGFSTLKVAAAYHPEFPNGDGTLKEPNLKVIDEKQFAKDVVTALNDENEEGETLVTRMFDHGMRLAAENGSMGLDYD